MWIFDYKSERYSFWPCESESEGRKEWDRNRRKIE